MRLTLLYRKGATIGDGGTADAIRINGDHIQKGIERITNLQNIINKQPLNQTDLEIAKQLLQNLIDALSGN